jgi:hypothetical protein
LCCLSSGFPLQSGLSASKHPTLISLVMLQTPGDPSALLKTSQWIPLVFQENMQLSSLSGCCPVCALLSSHRDPSHMMPCSSKGSMPPGTEASMLTAGILATFLVLRKRISHLQPPPGVTSSRRPVHPFLE